MDINNYFNNKKNGRFSDMDFHDFIEMTERGLSTDEISKEFGVPKTYVKKLSDELRKDY